MVQCLLKVSLRKKALQMKFSIVKLSPPGSSQKHSIITVHLDHVTESSTQLTHTDLSKEFQEQKSTKNVHYPNQLLYRSKILPYKDVI